MLDTVERPPMVRPHATLVYGLDDGCGLADSLWCDARTNAVCNLAVTSIGPEWARNTATKTLPVGCCTLQTDACRRVTVQETEPLTWLGAVAGTAIGFFVALHPVAVWAWASAVVGVVLLATDTHFWWPVCAALSLNYWCASAWIASAVTWDVGFALVLVALGMRGSTVLFGDPLAGEGPTVSITYRALRVRCKQTICAHGWRANSRLCVTLQVPKLTMMDDGGGGGARSAAAGSTPTEADDRGTHALDMSKATTKRKHAEVDAKNDNRKSHLLVLATGTPPHDMEARLAEVTQERPGAPTMTGFYAMGADAVVILLCAKDGFPNSTEKRPLPSGPAVSDHASCL
jgi:hypothetical protein